jgi:hypothetical protein
MWQPGAEWLPSEVVLVPIMVLSVYNLETGRPVSGLHNFGNFEVNVRGSSMGWGWCQPYSVREGYEMGAYNIGRESRSGFYEALISPPYPRSRWTFSMANDDCVFSVRVNSEEGGGQALASPFTPVRLPLHPLRQAIGRLVEGISIRLLRP